ncbi:MAG: hypothetical protein IJW99_05485 [Clostridia bacterium]|nr:hypothetical protein [Clostridia bacterium]
MKIQSLNGVWMRRIGCGGEREQQVPYSTLAVGQSTCRREFTVEVDAPRLFLRFDGITYHAKVFLNDVCLGEMLPYSEYEFEITDRVRAGSNTLSVELEDLNLSFGPTAGWENFSGIIRDVSLIGRGENYISDVFFKSRLCNGYRDAAVEVAVETDRPTEGQMRMELFDGSGTCVLSYRQAGGEVCRQYLSDVRLWSPDTPTLYRLCVTFLEGEQEIDRYVCRVGFRELTCDRHRFLLNGKHLFLKGVCKHEMIGNSGHVVSYEQIEQDMRMIKSTGCNFVRLVHYPHCKATVEIADRLGLMVSEEPGLWWSETANEEVAGGSLEVLRRVILRDRNHPSIVFWLSFNECRFTEKFLVDSANICHELDPTRLVSGANCMSNEDTLIYFNKCRFDFYTMHPYSPSFERAMKSAQMLYDKPLLFTEWGGHYVYDNPGYLRESIRKMAALYHQNSDEGALAGSVLWCWADYYDFNRGAPCVCGELFEGIVTMDRQKHLCYDAFCEEIAKIEEPPAPSDYLFTSLSEVEGEALVCESVGEDFSEMVSRVAEEARALPFHAQRQRKLKVGPRLEREEVAGISATPAVLGDGGQLVYTCRRAVSRLTLLGLTSFCKGYPIGGALSEKVAQVKVVFADGEQTYVLRNGREVTTVFATIASSRIDPIADRAPRFAEYSYDQNFEKYVINRLDLTWEGERTVDRVEITSRNRGYQLLMHGVFAK